MIAVDTSVVVAAFALWHVAHDAARRGLDRGPRLPAHAGLEAYSVLTRLPEPNRTPASVVRAFLHHEFPDPWLVLDGAAVSNLIGRLEALGLAGGAVYDALIAATAKAAGATLLTADRRALPTYRLLGVEVELIG